MACGVPFLACQNFDAPDIPLHAAGMRDGGAASAASTVCHAERPESGASSPGIWTTAFVLRDWPGLWLRPTVPKLHQSDVNLPCLGFNSRS